MLHCMPNVLTVPYVHHHKYPLSVLPKFVILSRHSQQEIGHPLLPSITYRAPMQSMYSPPYSQWKASG
jgi:hypothetical protein